MAITETPDKPISKEASIKKFQKDLVQAVKVGDFKKSAKLRESIKNLQK